MLLNNNKFWSQLSKWVRDNEDSPPTTKFIYDDGSELSSALAYTLYNEHKAMIKITETYDKECDYNRLLRKENYELMSYIDEMENFNEDDLLTDILSNVDASNNNNGNNNNNKNMLS